MADMPASPIDVVKSFMAAIAKKDFDTALQYVSDDCEYHNIPLAKVHGPAAVRGALEPFFAPTLENELVVIRAAAVGPVVFTERLDRRRLPIGWAELPVTGRHYVPRLTSASTGEWELLDCQMEMFRRIVLEPVERELGKIARKSHDTAIERVESSVHE